MIKAYKLFTGADGHSHIQTGSVATDILHHGRSIRFKETPPHSTYDWHNAPTNQYVICLTGTLEFETFPGEKFILNPGEVLIAMDTNGTAHKWKMLGDDPWKRAYVAFDEDKDINFIADEV